MKEHRKIGGFARNYFRSLKEGPWTEEDAKGQPGPRSMTEEPARGIVFDLFHTLVDPEDFRPKDFRRAIAVADILKLDKARFLPYWDSTTAQRMTTPRPEMDYVRDFAEKTGQALQESALDEAYRALGRYQGLALLHPRDEVVNALSRLEGAVDVTGNLKSDKRAHGSVDIYVEHVFVTQAVIDPERAFSGWVNCNALEPTTARNDVQKDKAYYQFMEHLKEYVAGKFPKKEEDLSREEMLLGAEVSNMLQNYLNHMKMLPKGLLPLGKGPEDYKGGRTRVRKTKEEVEHERKEIEEVIERVRKTSQTEKPVRRAVKSSFGLYFVDNNIGNEKPPLYYLYPNTVIRNTGNDLYKFALKSKANLGPKWLRLLPYISRVAVNINPKSKDWTHEQMET